MLVVYDEVQTLRLASEGRSIARFGDGELAIARGGKSVTQNADPKLRMELLHILGGRAHASVLPCVPRFNSPTPRRAFWQKYNAPQYTGLMRAREFGSSFISRPDNAPWIDNPVYWSNVRALWADKRVTYVGGEATLWNVMSVDVSDKSRAIQPPRRDAFSQIDAIEQHCVDLNGDVTIIALGAAGTALAARLAKRGLHALDLGFIGQFMKPEHQGAFAIDPKELATPEYRKLLQHAHATTNWGRGGASWADAIYQFVKSFNTTDVLDYGCGGGTLKPALDAKGLKCSEYDPGVIGKDHPPKIADVVVSTDVFEHIEPENVDNVLRHVFLLTRKAGFFVIAKQPAKKVLADGRNAHLSCHPAEWWAERLRAAGWSTVRVVKDEWKKCIVHCTK